MGSRDYNGQIIDDASLPSIIEGEISRSIGHFDGDLSEQRAKQFNYYYGRAFGNEVEGESQVISTDVADTVESILPAILRIFTSSDDAVQFDPSGPEDEEAAKQQTDVCNYVFYRQNNGFLVFYEWFKDALIQNNGIVKYWWEEKEERTKEEYKGLSEGEYRSVTQGDGYSKIEVLKHEQYDDPAALAAREIMKQQIMTQAPSPEQRDQALMMLSQQHIPQLHDVELRIVKDVSKICIEAIPPEEFGISANHNHVTIQDTPFCYHRSKKTLSALREMGCPDEILSQLAPASVEPDYSPEAIARDRFLDMTWNQTQGLDVIDKWVWVTECFIRIDWDGDGKSELRHIIMPGRTVWINEEAEHINFAAITPVIMPHRWVGRSVAELVMDIQYTKSVIWRQMLNNLYLTNNPRKAVLSSAGGIMQANVDDLLTSRPGGIMREYVPNAIRNEEVPFVAGASFPMLEYMDGLKENRTGSTRYNQGTDANSLNKTARGIQLIQSAGQQRLDLIARIFAETGVKDLMRGITYLLSKFSQKPLTIKLRNKWVDVDPREWKTQFNMTVNVGLGTGNKDIQLQHLGMMHEQQIELIKEGRGYMVSDENIFNLYTKTSEAMGFKHPELFVTDPEKVPPEAKQKPPDPAAMKVQADAAEGQAKLKLNAQTEQFRAAAEKELETIRQQAAVAIANINASNEKEITQMKIEAQARMSVFDKQHEINSTGADLATKREAAMAQIALDREIAAEKAKLEREQAEARVTLAAWEAQESAKLAREVAVQHAQTENMKAQAVAAKARKAKPATGAPAQ